MMKKIIEIESNHDLHNVIIMEAIQEYMEHRGYFCWVTIKDVDIKKYVKSIQDSKRI